MTTELEDYLICPVCLGLPMTKLRFAHPEGKSLILDYCKRCNGMWFDQGEVQALQGMKREQIKGYVPLKESDRLFLCHGCMEPMSRNLDCCPQCHWKNRLHCPRCRQSMQLQIYKGLNLDICKPCRGVWFDNFELAQLWNISFDDSHKLRAESASSLGDIFLMGAEIVTYSPYLTIEVLEASAEVAASVLIHTPEAAGAAVEAVTHLPEIAGTVFEGAADMAEITGEAAGSIFEVIAEILGGVFG